MGEREFMKSFLEKKNALYISTSLCVPCALAAALIICACVRSVCVCVTCGGYQVPEATASAARVPHSLLEEWAIEPAPGDARSGASRP